MRSSRFAAFAALSLVTISTAAYAVQLPPELVGHEALESATGAPLATQRAWSHDRVPLAARAAWARLGRDTGGAFATSDWDGIVPTRIWGRGIPAPGVMASPAAAEAFARKMLARHVDLLAPGASADDFALSANELDPAMRTVGFVQQRAGMPVLGAHVSFRFKNDRLFMMASEAAPFVSTEPVPFVVSTAKARAAAASWVKSDVASVAVAGGVEGPFVLPMRFASGRVEYPAVLRVTVDASVPTGRWSVYVDAATGVPVAREQTLRFASGTLQFNAPVRWPGSDRFDYPAGFVDVTVDGASSTTDAAGVASYADGGPGQLTAHASGPRATVANDAGAEAVAQLTLPNGGSVTWNQANDSEADAQLATYVHALKARDYAKVVAPAMGFLSTQIKATVNENDQCNAYSDGTTIHFYQASNACENTGRLADVVYHEFGHSFHAHAIIQGVGEFEGALSEGQSDYLSATITNDPAMGRGFFYDAQPLRQIDPPNKEYKWPDDVAQDPHETGYIISGALWDLRKALAAKMGDAAGVAHTDQLWYLAIRRAVDIPSMYPEVLAADDDDGDLENGTPNVCEIAAAFGAHGLRTMSAELPALGTVPPTQDGYKISLTLEGLFPQCPGDGVSGAKLVWRLREDTTKGGELPMTGQGNILEATIPAQASGQVVQFQVQVDLGAGSTITYPDNAADPRYEFFVGDVKVLYCTDFETDPEVGGWTHGLTDGAPGDGADDWMWGAPNAPASSGDPADAFSGKKVFGNDLGGGNFNGMYQPDHTNFALSPVVPTNGATNVRLQYRRWLNVEDANFDHATIYVNDQKAWQNFDSMSGDNSHTQHTDKEWRFHDVDLTPFVKDGNVQIKWEIDSDPGLEFGGWTLDDVCVVSYTSPSPPTCEDVPAMPGCGGGGSGPGTGGGDVGTGGQGTTPLGAAANGADEDSGCGCRVAGDGGRDDEGLAALAALALTAVLVRRRRARA